MSDWLLLRLPRAAGSSAEWLVCDPQGQAMSAPQSGPLADAAPVAAGKRVCALLHSAEVLTTLVDLPAKSGTRSLQIARYALEEQLLGDIEQQHFALGRRSDFDGRTPVAVIEKERMKHWLSLLSEAGIRADLLCPESALLPRHPTEIVALLDQGMLTVVPSGPGAQPVCLPGATPAAALGIALDGRELAEVDLLVFAAPADWKIQAAQVEALRPQLASLRVHVLNDGLLPWLAPQLVQSPLNLLQGEWQPRHGSTGQWSRWRVAASMAIALLLIHLGSQGWALVSAHRAELASDQTLQALATQLLPGEKLAAGAVRRRAGQLLQTGGSSGGMLHALQSVAAATTASGGAQLRALNFHDGGTELQVRANDAQSVERFNQALRGAGWNAELVAGGAAGGHYEGRIQMKTPKGAGARP